MSILSVAAELSPADLRALDALHLATALSTGDDLAGLVTYDLRLTAAALRARVTVLAPA